MSMFTVPPHGQYLYIITYKYEIEHKVSTTIKRKNKNKIEDIIYFLNMSLKSKTKKNNYLTWGNEKFSPVA